METNEAVRPADRDRRRWSLHLNTYVQQDEAVGSAGTSSSHLTPYLDTGSSSTSVPAVVPNAQPLTFSEAPLEDPVEILVAALESDGSEDMGEMDGPDVDFADPVERRVPSAGNAIDLGQTTRAGNPPQPTALDLRRGSFVNGDIPIQLFVCGVRMACQDRPPALAIADCRLCGILACRGCAVRQRFRNERQSTHLCYRCWSRSVAPEGVAHLVDTTRNEGAMPNHDAADLFLINHPDGNPRAIAQIVSTNQRLTTMTQEEATRLVRQELEEAGRESFSADRTSPYYDPRPDHNPTANSSGVANRVPDDSDSDDVSREWNSTPPSSHYGRARPVDVDSDQMGSDSSIISSDDL